MIMKMIFLSYSAGIDEEIADALADLGIKCYTKWQDVLGIGNTSGPHLGTHVWPKTNSFLGIAIEEEKVDGLLHKVRELKATFGKEGVKAFVLPLEEAV